MADMVEFELAQWAQTLPADRRLEAQMLYASQKKDPGTALALSLLMFLGFAGIGRIYMGSVVIGIVQLLFGWATCGIWPLVDLFLIMGATEQYNRGVLQRVMATYGR